MSTPPTAGTTIGQRYRLVRKLAEGGMGEVWVAEHLVTRRQVAIKFLKPGLGPSAHRRVIREAQAACAIEHPAAVPIHDVIEDDAGAPALVMDLLSGESLESYLRRLGKLRVEEVAPLLLPIAEALAEAHGRGIVHRDLKPANVFITTSGASRLLDFGLVKEVEGATTAFSDASATAAGAILGTPIYMSPEQAVGEATLDARTDVWSFGLVLYEALTGILPTRAESFSKLLKFLLTVQIPPVSSLDPTLPAPLVTLLSRMLERDVAARTVTMAEVADVLRPLAAGAHHLRPAMRSSGEVPMATPVLDEVSDTLMKPRTIPEIDDLSDTDVKRLSAPPLTPKTPVPTAERLHPPSPPPTPGAPPEPPKPLDPTPTAPPPASPATLPLPATRRPRWPLFAGAAGIVVAAAFVLRPDPTPPVTPVTPTPTPSPIAAVAPSPPRGLLDAPTSTVGCAVFEASGVEGTGGWLGAAVSSIACRRMQWMLGGEVARILPPPVLIDATPGLDERAPKDPYEAPEVRQRSLAAAAKRASATLDGRVDRTPGGFHLTLRLLSPDGVESARAETTSPNLFDLVDGAGRALEKAGAYPVAKQLKADVAESYGIATPEFAWQADRPVVDRVTHFGDPAFCRKVLDLPGEQPLIREFVRTLCGLPSGDGGLDPPPIDHSSPATLVLTTLGRFGAGHPVPDRGAIGEELAALSTQATNPDARATLAHTARLLLVLQPGTDTAPLLRETTRQVPWSAAWAGSFSGVGDVLSGSERRGLLRSAKQWAPFDVTDWTTAGEDDEDPEEFIKWPRRFYEITRSDHAALEYSRRLLLLDRSNEARSLAAPLATGTPEQRTIGTYLLVAADGTDGLPARALQRAAHYYASVTSVVSVEAGIRIPLRAAMIAEVLGTREAMADAWVDRFVLGEKPLLARELRGAIASASICMQASPAKRTRCLTVVGSLFDFRIDPQAAAYLAGARRAAASDFSGAVREWRPLLQDVTTLAHMPVEVFDAAHEPELADSIDKTLISQRSHRCVRGHGLAELRVARRVLQSGDKAKARALSKELLGAWSTLDAEVPWLPELRRMAAE